MREPQHHPEPPAASPPPGPSATGPVAPDQAPPPRELWNRTSPAPAASAPASPLATGLASSEHAPPRCPLGDRVEPGIAGLTRAQREVVEHIGGPLLVVAGPGAGKTRTLTARLCHLIATAQVQPAEIVAVTFTRKAAGELQERLLAALGARARELTVGTFHRVALLLRPLPAGTTLLSEGDRILFCEQALEDVATRSARQPARLAPKLARVLSLLKGQRSDWLQGLEKPEPDRPEPVNQLADQPADQFAEQLIDQLVGAHRADFQAAARRYAELLAQHQAEDLDDLLLHALSALRAGTAARAFSYIAVDEYQDVSGVQRELVRALGERAGVLAIGDPDQAIYAFRGAEVGHFHAFAQDFPGARLLHLRENFRSQSNLVAAAAAVIANQPARSAPQPIATRPAGAPLVRFTAPSPLGEALFIVREIDSLVGGTSLLSHDARRATAWAGASYGFSDIAVLTRTAARADELASALQQEGVPIQRPRRAHLDSAAARELVAYLRLCARPDEPGADVGALWRVLRCEARAAGLAPGAAPPPLAGVSGAARFAAVPEPLRTTIAARIAALLPLALPDRLTALAKALGATEKDTAAVRAQLTQLGPQLLQLADHSHESDEWQATEERVAVLTLHGAKGLEFPVVFVAGCEAGLLPGSACSPAELAEERRLFYVGLTRARDRLYVSCVSRDPTTAEPAPPPGDRPSPFLDELPAHLVHRPAPPKRRPKPPQLKLF